MLEKLNRRMILIIDPQLDANDWGIVSHAPINARNNTAAILNQALKSCLQDKLHFSHGQTLDFMKRTCASINEKAGEILLGQSTYKVIAQVLDYIYFADIDDGK